ncbi:MAG: intradiol ring-cleavage dioxygenase [Alphaproteobacteria bacterium]|nr:intradiol ring-cleavage dioxygenase [Alphaproteobacteria bacterium]MCW5743158.1 intradiol ring-cleavage dioxygenase [Alphaproteobacteria bacterium]
MRNFTEANLTEEVVARMGEDCDPRLREVMSGLIRHVHAFVRETRLTPEEWMKGIQFLTEVGKWCDDKRQEYILLSDTMGVSMLVDAIANPSAGNTTESTVLGPFFRENPPIIANGGDISPGIAGKRIDVDCRVLSEDGTPISGAQIDCWQASPDGGYDSQMGDGSKHNLRGRLKSDAAGRFWFETTLPACYPIPDDGPVGELLRAMGRHPWRPGHLHFWVQAPGHRQVITHLFVRGDQYLDSDVVFGVKEALISDFGAANDRGRLSYDFRLKKAA